MTSGHQMLQRELITGATKRTLADDFLLLHIFADAVPEDLLALKLPETIHHKPIMKLANSCGARDNLRILPVNQITKCANRGRRRIRSLPITSNLRLKEQSLITSAGTSPLISGHTCSSNSDICRLGVYGDAIVP